jgi:hypothetical protein
MLKTFVQIALASFLIGACALPFTAASADSVLDHSSKGRTARASSDEPLWRVNLQSVGYPANEVAVPSRRDPEISRTVDFLSEDVVVANFVTRQSEPDLPKRDDPNRPRRDILHAIFMDATTGQVLKTMEWPTDNSGAGIFPRYDGSFLYFSPERIVLYSREWAPVKELVLPQLQDPRVTLTGVSESPSGKFLELRILREHSAVCVRIQTSTLEGGQEKCITQSAGRYSISDDAIAQTDQEDVIEAIIAKNNGQTIPTNPAAPFKLKIMIREQNSDAQLLCDINGVVGCNNPQFVDNRTIVVYGLAGLTLLASNGETKDRSFRKVYTSGNAWVDVFGGAVRPSPDGRRFVVVFDEPPETFGSSDTVSLNLAPDHFDVYDVVANAIIYTLKNKKNEFKNISGLALSPKGQKLAVDSGGVIQMYALPSRKDN